MKQEEKTVGLPVSDDNIVHVNFVRGKRLRRRRKGQGGLSTFVGLISRFDLKSPWVIRLTAVVVILILSMLVL